MSKIKTRDTTKDIKVFDRAAIAGKHMKDAFIKSKDAVSSIDKQAEQTQDAGHNSPSEYASDRITGGARNTAERAARGLKKNPVKKASNNANRAKENFQEAKRQMNNIRDAVKKPSAEQPKKEMVRRAKETARRTASRTKQAADRSIKTVQQSEKTIKQAARGADRTIKTASKTIKGAAKATRNTVTVKLKPARTGG